MLLKTFCFHKHAIIEKLIGLLLKIEKKGEQTKKCLSWNSYTPNEDLFFMQNTQLF